jgi:hypothetical protein
MGELTCVYRQNLATLVITTRRTGGVPTHTGTALRTLGKLWSMPAVRRLAGAQAHFGGFTFWNSHKSVYCFCRFSVIRPSRTPHGAFPGGWEASAGACEKRAGQLFFPSASQRG